MRRRIQDEIIVDCFAGGGGASTGIEWALGRSPDVAINHDPEALAMHRANHPRTRHYATDVFEVDPDTVARGKPVGLAWFSPDCTQFSKAKGGKPIRDAGKKSRALAWVVIKWAKKRRPRVIMLENVEEWLDWGPVIHKVGQDGYPVFNKDGTPWYVPCPKRKGSTFRRWLSELRKLGYVVEWKELRGCDYGAPTIRKRLFLIARCDGRPIVWPEPTHGDPKSEAVKSGRLKPWRTAAEIIDWTIPCHSIFLTPEEAKRLRLKRPLEPATMARIARGVFRFVINNPDPFIVYANHGGDWFRGRSVNDPMPTLTCSRDAINIVNPFVQNYHGGADSPNRVFNADSPLHTQTTENRFGLVAPIISRAQHGGGERPADAPVHTLTASDGDQNQVVSSVLERLAPFMVPRYGERKTKYVHRCGTVNVESTSARKCHRCGKKPYIRPQQKPRSSSVQEPMPTVVPTGNGGQIVAPVLQRDFGNSTGSSVDAPMGTVMPGGGGKAAVVSAFLAQHNTGVTGHPATVPLSTLTQRATQQQVVSATLVTNTTRHAPTDVESPVPTLTTGGQQLLAAACLSHQRGSNKTGSAGDVDQPLNAITGGGNHVAQVMAFLQLYYSQGGQHSDVRRPSPTIPTKDRLGLVTIDELDYQIVDIGMRMFTPRELFLAQGFTADYLLNVSCEYVRKKGKKKGTTYRKLLPKSSLVRMCGNSVCPPLAKALVEANVPELRAKKKSKEWQPELLGV